MSQILYLLTDKPLSSLNNKFEKEYGNLNLDFRYICNLENFNNMHLYYVDCMELKHGLGYGKVLDNLDLDFLDEPDVEAFRADIDIPQNSFFEFVEQFEDMYKVANGICYWYQYIHYNIHKLGKIGLWISKGDFLEDIKSVENYIGKIKTKRKNNNLLTPGDLAQLRVDRILMVEE